MEADVDPGRCTCTVNYEGLVRMKTQSRGPRRVETEAVVRVHQLGMKAESCLHDFTQRQHVHVAIAGCV